MNKQYSLFIFGLINLIEGVLGIYKGKIFIRGWKEITILEAFIWLLSGVVLIFISKNLKNSIEHTICPTCKQTYNSQDLKDGKCPTCKDVDTVEIEKYYKDNPFKEKDEKRDD